MMAILTWVAPIVGYLKRATGEDMNRILVLGFLIGLIDYIATVIGSFIYGIIGEAFGLLAVFLTIAVVLLLIGAATGREELTKGAIVFLVIGFLAGILGAVFPTVATVLKGLVALESNMTTAISSFYIVIVDLLLVTLGAATEDMVKAAEVLRIT